MNIGARLRTHSKNLQFTEIIFIHKCMNNMHMRHIETCIKREAEQRKERDNVMGNTELIHTADISHYINFIFDLKYEINNRFILWYKL